MTNNNITHLLRPVLEYHLRNLFSDGVDLRFFLILTGSNDHETRLSVNTLVVIKFSSDYTTQGCFLQKLLIFSSYGVYIDIFKVSLFGVIL